MTKTKRLILFTAQAALIAALYAVLTLAAWSFSSMAIQVRISEALCVLPLFTPAAIPGLFIGCFLSNIIAGNVPDAVFGSLTTLIAAALTWLIGKAVKNNLKIIPGPFPAVLLKAIVVPFILYYGYNIREFMGYTEFAPVMALTALSVFIGQTIACYGIGVPLYFALKGISDRTDLFRVKKKNAARDQANNKEENRIAKNNESEEQ